MFEIKQIDKTAYAHYTIRCWYMRFNSSTLLYNIFIKRDEKSQVVPKSMRNGLQTHWLTYVYLFLIAPPVIDDTNENWGKWKYGGDLWGLQKPMYK